MGVFTFVCKASGSEWTAKQLKGDLEASACSTYDLQRKLVQAALAEDCSGGVQSSFSYVLPTSAVFQFPSLVSGSPLNLASLLVVSFPRCSLWVVSFTLWYISRPCLLVRLYQLQGYMSTKAHRIS
nr:60S acidic ribosomal protein P3-like [Ipomoea batatas]